MLQVINIDQDGFAFKIEIDLNQKLDQLRKIMDKEKFLFIDKDGIQIDAIFESNFKISDIHDEITNTVYIKTQQKLYEYQSEMLQQLESQKQQIEILEKSLKESLNYNKILVDEIEKLKKLDDQDAKKQQANSLYINLSLNKEYYEEEEYKLQNDEYQQKKFINDSDYFKSLLLNSNFQNLQKDKSYQNNDLNNANRNDDNDQAQLQQKRSQSIYALLYPPQKLKELSYEEQQKKKVEHIVNTIRPRMECDLNRLESIMREMLFVLKHKDDINMNHNLHFTATIESIKKVETSYNNTICLSCNRTCHENCSYVHDKQGCIAIQEDYCTVCPKKCFWNQHLNTNYKIEYQLITKITTFDDLRKIYCLTDSDALQSDQILLGLMKEYLITKKKIFDDVNNLKIAINRLGDLMNRPNNVKALEIIANMIIHERNYKKIGFQQRINGLEEIKVQFQNINGLVGQKQEDAIEEFFYNYKQSLIEFKLNNINHFLF